MPTKRPVSAPTACERLEQVIARCGGSLTLRAGETRVESSLPSSAPGEMGGFLQPNSTASLEPAFLARLPDGWVFGSGNVLAPDGQTIARDVSPDFGKPFQKHWLLTYPKLRPPVPLPGTTAVIATTLGAG